MDFELTTLSETRQCKKLIPLLSDDGMDLEGLANVELTLDTLWTKFEDFYKPQSNEVRARFDLLIRLRQGGKSVDEWLNAVQKQINLCKKLVPFGTATFSVGDSICLIKLHKNHNFGGKKLTAPVSSVP